MLGFDALHAQASQYDQGIQAATDGGKIESMDMIYRGVIKAATPGNNKRRGEPTLTVDVVKQVLDAMTNILNDAFPYTST